jgi:hypothetical protein
MAVRARIRICYGVIPQLNGIALMGRGMPFSILPFPGVLRYPVGALKGQTPGSNHVRLTFAWI